VIQMLLLRVLPRRLLPLLTLVQVLLLVRRLLAGRRTAARTASAPSVPTTIATVNGQQYGS
jgi:hypothetical protein